MPAELKPTTSAASIAASLTAFTSNDERGHHKSPLRAFDVGLSFLLCVPHHVVASGIRWRSPRKLYTWLIPVRELYSRRFQGPSNC